MSGHLAETTLNDFADGTLHGEARSRAAQHLAHCVECRRRADALAELRGALAALRRDVAPPSALLSDIHAAIESGPAAATAPGRTQRRRVALLAAAAAALMAATALVTALLLRPDPPAVARDTAPSGAVRLISAHPLERTWQDAIADVQRELAGQESTLAPETRRIIEANLEIIDRALAEARAALLADPANADLADVLRSGYERKLDMLRSAAEHTRPAS